MMTEPVFETVPEATRAAAVTVPGKPPTPLASLPDDHLACELCGVAVPPPHVSVITLDLIGRAISNDGCVHLDRGGGTTELLVTTCPECQELRDQAAQLVADHPRVRAGIGAPEIAVFRVENALAAAQLFGISTWGCLASDAGLARLINHLAMAGGSLRWSRQVAPVLGFGLGMRSCAVAPWAHVGPELRAAARDAAAGYLRALVEVPRPIAPPAGVGCLLCGVAHVVALPSDRDGAWYALEADLHALGGPHAVEPLSGSVCRVCALALDEIGSVGPSAMERSLAQHLAGLGRSQLADRLTRGELGGLVGWGALDEMERRAGRAGIAPNAEPWQHVRVSDDDAA